ncbi:MAG: hypothetical protein ABI882_07925 [Acidobacteriota bacterium]
MRKFLTLSAALSLMLTASLVASTASALPQSANSTVENLLGLLPDSDVMGVIDMPRAARELLPLLKSIESGGIAALASDFEQFAGLAGLDPTKVTSAVVGVKMNGLAIRGGALIAEGIELDPKSVEKVAIARNWKFQTIDPDSRPIYRIERITAPGAPAAPAEGARDTAPAKSDELFFAPLTSKRVVAGDLASVRAVLANVTAGQQKTAANATIRGALSQNSSAGLVRFALVLPADLRQMLDGQGELFQQIAAVKVIFGTIDMTSDQSASINARLATTSKDEATQMGTSLKSLAALGKTLLGGSEDVLMKGIAQLLDQVQIGTVENDVSLSLLIPRSLLDQLTKTPK